MDTNIIEYPLSNEPRNQLDSIQNLLGSEVLIHTKKFSSLLSPLEDIQLKFKQDITPEELKDLFEKNTESFRCLAQILISRSSIFGHPLYRFDPPTDPGIEEAFNYKVVVEQLDTIGIHTYKNYCKKYEIVPISRVIKSLPTNTLDLKYYGLSLKQIKALAAALVFNIYVENLILEENVLDSEALYHISEMLRDNNKISYLNMKHCWISPEAIGKLSEGIYTSQLVRELDLSYNNIQSNGLASLTRSIRNNMSIKKLNLSHNGLMGDVCWKLGRALAENDCLEELDISWNNFNDGLHYLCEGLIVKDILKFLNLSWNGISTMESLIPITKYMKATKALEHIDLSNNQMQGPLIKTVRSAILRNSSLISVNMSSNIITPEDASFLAHVFTADRGELTEPLKLKYLDMENILVNNNFLPYWKKLTKEGKFVRIEGVLGNYKVIGPDEKKLLFNRIRYQSQKTKKKKSRKEFGHFLYNIDKTVQEPTKQPIAKEIAPSAVDTEYMMKSDFLTALKKFKIGKVYNDEDLLKEILKKYTNNKDKINTSLMRKEYYNYYPETTIPEIKKKKPAGKKGKRKKGKIPATLSVEDQSKADSKDVPLKSNITIGGIKKSKGFGLVFKDTDYNDEEVPDQKTNTDITGQINKTGSSVNDIDKKSELQLLYADDKSLSQVSDSKQKKSENDVNDLGVSTVFTPQSKSILKNKASAIISTASKDNLTENNQNHN